MLTGDARTEGGRVVIARIRDWIRDLLESLDPAEAMSEVED